MTGSSLRRLASTIGLAAALIGCGSGGGSGAVSPPASAAAPSADPFAGLPYRLDLPAGWIALGSAEYDSSIDATADVARWLDALELSGDAAFRAYEPKPGAAGLRLAINPPVGWNSDAEGPITDRDQLAALAGVTGSVEGDYLAVGASGKALRMRWTQVLDWGTGAPTTRDCAGYQVMTEFDPVNVVFTWPSDTDRLAEVEALIATFKVSGNPVSTIPPGATPTPSPTPYDKDSSPQPEPTEEVHAAPELEALLPDAVDGRSLAKSSRTGVELGITEADPLLALLGAAPADLATAMAVPETPPLLIVSVTRLRGVSADRLLAAIVAQMPDASISTVSIGGRELTYVPGGAWPVWYLASGSDLYGITADDATLAQVVAMLPSSG